MAKNLIEMLGEEKDEEEELVFAPQLSQEAKNELRLASALEDAGAVFAATGGDLDYVVTSMFNNNISVKPGQDYLKRATVLAAAHGFIDSSDYGDLELGELVKKVAIDVYTDFFMSLPALAKAKREEKPAVALQKQEVKPITPAEYFKGRRADIFVVTNKLAELYRGVEPAIEYMGSISELRNLAATNIILDYYTDEKAKEDVRGQIISGSIRPSEMLVYSIIKYHQAILNNLR